MALLKKFKNLCLVSSCAFGLWVACSTQEFTSESPSPMNTPTQSEKNNKKKSENLEGKKTSDQQQADTATVVDSNTLSGATDANGGTSAPTGQGQSDSQLASSGSSNSNVVTFVIPKGTGSGAWNNEQNPIRVKVGQTLEVVNEDTIRHQIHTNGRPFFHPLSSIPPGGKATYKIQSEFSGALYDHLTFGRFFLTTK